MPTHALTLEEVHSLAEYENGGEETPISTFEL